MFLDKFSVQQRGIEWEDFKWTVFNAILPSIEKCRALENF